MSLAGTLEHLTAGRLLPVVTLPDVESAVPLGRTLLDAGLPVVEIACRTSAAIPGIRQLREACPDLLVGAGTVLSPALAREAVGAGAQFLVSPGYNEDTLNLAKARGVPMLPGVLTPTEVDRAHSGGQRLLKLFPAASLGGAGYVASLADVYPDLRFVPTGGIHLENISTYLALTNVAACGGSWLAPMRLLRERRFEEIWSCVAAAVAIVRSAGAVGP